ncbi:hypothetical protein AB0K00_35265 [Dactylosporangium sp. NPDC049525]|uniref:tetratricopeptide repeat protein n=1 Tax=Dactylosporangium sp. NPDC049525 TaxID=3154730 RepID=UPI003449038B
MSADESRPSSSRPIVRVELPQGPVAAFRDFLYELYLRSGPLTLDELVRRIDTDDAEDPDVLGNPGRDVVHQMISGKALPAKLHDAVTVARLLARAGGGDPAEADRKIRELLVAARMPPPRLGRPIGACDPFDLEVHRSIALPERAGALPVLPPYVPRGHDTQLAESVAAVIAGQSRLVALVGGSSTGKTRACWEAVQALPGRWRLWHPIDPTRQEAAVAALAQVGAETVLWLNEAQHYLLLPHNPSLGEQVAAGLRTLLHDPRRRPVLILATMWPKYWDTLTAEPAPGGADPYAQARALLAGTGVRVPDSFTDADLQTLRDSAGGDPRLDLAARAPGGQVTQQLAGVPALIERYEQAGAVARAVIDAAIDARRLGHPVPIPHALLEQAAPGYLTDHEWDQAGDDWLEQALAYTAKPCHGVPGPLIRIRPRPGDRTQPGGPHYRLADYLEQTGRAERADTFPPPGFWNAAAALTDPRILRQFGGHAEQRGRYQRAVQLYQRTVELGDTGALWRLAVLRDQSGDHAGAAALVRQAIELSAAGALQLVAELRYQAGDQAGAAALVQQAVELGHTDVLRRLAVLRNQVGDHVGAEALVRQGGELSDTGALRLVAVLRDQAGDHAGAEVLARQAAELGDTSALRFVAELRSQAGDHAGAEALARQAAELGDTSALRLVAELRNHAGDHAGAEVLARQAAELGDTSALQFLAVLRDQAGDHADAAAFARRAGELGDTSALQLLAMLRDRAGDHAGAEAVARQAAELGDTSALRFVAELRDHAGDQDGAEVLARQAADLGDTSALQLLAVLRHQAGDPAGAETLVRRALDLGDTSALRLVAVLRNQAGDHARAEALARQAVQLGDTGALRFLAKLRDRAGDHVGAEGLARQAVQLGDTDALRFLAELRDRAGDQVGADRIRRFGLLDSGTPATSLTVDHGR